MSHPAQGPDTLPKPAELLALHGVSAELFDLLRRWFDVGPSVVLDLREIDSAVVELGDPQMIAAVAMRKLQAMNLIATPGVLTATDVVVAMVNDLNRALIQAPSMYLNLRAETTDWDQAFEALDDLDADAPAEASATDPEIERFEELHGLLHDALIAVIEASDGEIRYFS
ncbi:MAG: hypothetical protein OEU32_09270 [Acidimicrobiia bacterium]|nr:hypothetical protein [Acidimicrobiia bacterium]